MLGETMNKVVSSISRLALQPVSYKKNHPLDLLTHHIRSRGTKPSIRSPLPRTMRAALYIANLASASSFS